MRGGGPAAVPSQQSVSVNDQGYVPARFAMSSIRRLRGVDETHFRSIQFLHESPDGRQLGLAQEAICHRRILVASADPIHADLLGAAQDQR
jgi:hypothetical protein